MPSGKAEAAVNGTIIASTTEWEFVEGNVYFPPGSIKKEYFTTTDQHTICSWKGEASYYSLEVDGQKLDGAAWYYPQPKEKAANIKDYVAFYKTKVDITSKEE